MPDSRPASSGQWPAPGRCRDRSRSGLRRHHVRVRVQRPQVLGQIGIGTTIGLGLLFDTLIVRSFLTPSIATLLGRWFWWPLRVRPRPASQMLQPYGSRPAVRQLLLWDDEDTTVTSG